MKISIAQTRPTKGDISANIEAHVRLINLAASLHASSIFFPELSLTGYEPELAQDLATTQDDSRFDALQHLSNHKKITIGAGIPTKSDRGTRISMVIFQPGKPRATYSKQQLHADELPYFLNGDIQVMLNLEDKRVAPAICYESMQPSHVTYANKLGAEIYLASVAKSQNGITKAMTYYPDVAKKYAMPVLLSNCVGYCDNFLSVGNSAVWTSTGHLAAQLGDQNEGIIVFDTETEQAIFLTL
jgi:predicted amidohydrolase